MTWEGAMAFRELFVVEIREILRRWQRGDGFRTVAVDVGTDRKTVRRYVDAAVRRGLSQAADSRVIDDDLLAEVIAEILPGPKPKAGVMRELCRRHRALIDGWVRDGCKAPKIVRLLHGHVGETVPERTLRRFIQEELGDGEGGTVRIVDPPPGQVLEVDFMEVGPVEFDGAGVKLLALVCIAASSRYAFLWPCISQDRDHLIEGLEAAWSFFGGVFPVVVFDNPRTAVA
jgi:transposase